MRWITNSLLYSLMTAIAGSAYAQGNGFVGVYAVSG
jgi:hypothetical protein